MIHVPSVERSVDTFLKRNTTSMENIINNGMKVLYLIIYTHDLLVCIL